jgi:FixJ family two-component response regulator
MLTDVVLPGTSGREIAREVHARRPSIRVLYMSGYTESTIQHDGILEPRLAFIQKPFPATCWPGRFAKCSMRTSLPRSSNGARDY